MLYAVVEHVGSGAEYCGLECRSRSAVERPLAAGGAAGAEQGIEIESRAVGANRIRLETCVQIGGRNGDHVGHIADGAQGDVVQAEVIAGC